MFKPALIALWTGVALIAGTPHDPRTLAVAMRDGIHLATDVYGAQPGMRKPALLLRTPYNKSAAGAVATARRFAGAGYVAVVQDTRGAFASEGKYVHYNNDDQDGFDTLEWIAEQPWSNGKTGMWGSSHPGAVQWVAAADRGYGLVAIAPTAAPSSFYHTMYQGGALRLGLTAGAGVSINPPPPGIKAPENLTEAHYHLPLSTLDEYIGWPMPWLKGVINHNRPDGFWRRLNGTPELRNLNVAAQITVGYYDLFCADSVHNFVRLPKNGKKQLILGPWDHSTVGQQVTGNVDFGPDAKLDLAGQNLTWFHRFLKPGAADKSFPVARYFVMGDNVWRTSSDWPPPEAVTTPFYLHSAGKANSRGGDGSLSRKSPAADEPGDQVTSDPDKPVPSEIENAPKPSRSTPWRPVDRTPIEDRQDVLVYTAAIQKTPITIAGHVLADLWVSVDAVDADWAVKLLDVSPDGAARGLAEGILRSSARSLEDRSELLEPGRRYHLTVDLGHTAATILSGHTIRIEIAGSAFPMFDRNLHTGEGPTGARKPVAIQTVYHATAAASRIMLPVLKP